MVWIHGGGFTAGQATLFDASYLAIQGDVIIVTINYRLGIFGFLYTGDANAPGNYGLFDQRLAMQWVKDKNSWQNKVLRRAAAKKHRFKVKWGQLLMGSL